MFDFSFFDSTYFFLGVFTPSAPFFYKSPKACKLGELEKQKKAQDCVQCNSFTDETLPDTNATKMLNMV